MTDLTLEEMPGRTQDAEDKRRRRRRRQRRTALVLVLAVVLLGGAGYAAWNTLRGVVSSFSTPPPEDFAGPGSGEVQVKVLSGQTGTDVARTLEEAGVVASVGAMTAELRADPEAAARIQPGTYSMLEGMAAADAVDRITDQQFRISLVVAVPEGFTKEQVAERSAEATGLPLEQFEAALADPAALGLPPAANGDPEGFLYPATYDFEPDITAVEVLRTMVDRSKAALAEVGVPEDQQREVVIKASLVEEEAGLDEDFPRVARVIENRLAIGMPLQFDSTVNYATGEDGITTTDEQRAVDSPYNTYRYPGLPAGPISSPGELALRSVLEPAEGDWLYFVTVNPDTGETRFTNDLTEHNRNVLLFREWAQNRD